MIPEKADLWLKVAQQWTKNNEYPRYGHVVTCYI